MSQPHVIRLRGPWLCWPESGDPAREETALTIDCRDDDALSQLPAAHPQRRVLFKRRFQRPTGLTSATTIQLVVESSTRELSVTLNSQQLGFVDSGRHEFDVSDGLQSANQLQIELPSESTRERRSLTDLFSCQLEIT